jgi:phage shock protein C
MIWNNEPNDRPSPSRLYRNRRDGVILGVCTGIADYFGVQRWVVRVLWVGGLLMFPPPTIIGYFLLALLLPKAPEHLYENKDEEHFWRDVRVDPARKFSELRHKFREQEQRLRGMESYVTSEAYRVHREINELER